jgi:metal-responsive CopG/Arc/MetJ family transcriptional regulator
MSKGLKLSSSLKLSMKDSSLTQSSIRLPKGVLDRLDKIVEQEYPKIKSRNHLIEIIIYDYIEKIEKDQNK